MKKQFFKRKKLGMALVLTLMVSVVVMAIASTYLGMVGSSAKAARAYSKEALALSMAQTGLNATLNAMGIPGNWDSTQIINRFDNLQNLSLTTENNRIIYEHDALAVTLENRATNLDSSIRKWFYNDVSGNYSEITTTNAAYFLSTDTSDDYSSFYSCGPITIMDDATTGTTKNAYLIIGVAPENNLSGANSNIFNNLSRNNLNYSVGIVSLIFEPGFIPTDLTKSITNLNHLSSSRIIKYRVSSIFPGSIYQNMAAADYPGTNHANEAHYGYPNWTDLTADAAFMDENTQWDGAMAIDGASTSSNGFGAPRGTNGNFCVYDGTNNGYLSGNINVDTSGVLKVSILNRNDAANIDTTDHLPKIGKTASATQRLVYYNMTDGAKSDLRSHPHALNNICTSSTNPYVDNASSIDIDTIWQRKDDTGNITSSLLSAVNDDGTPIEGLYREMKRPTAYNPDSNANTTYPVSDVKANKGFISFGSASYQPDPMYANESMEVPTVRITVSYDQNAGEDKYTIERIGYRPNMETGSGWQETVVERVDNLMHSDVNDMIYISGANVQVQGEISQPISIVSDVNPKIESDNYKTEYAGKTINGHTVQAPLAGTGNIFDKNLNSPNILNTSTSQYKYVDPQLDEATGVWGVNTSISTADTANSLISTVAIDNTNYSGTTGDNVDCRLNRQNTEDFRFPTYSVDEQPSGNITIIGNLTVKNGTNPSIGIIAKNRVLLNNMNHETPNAPATKQEIYNNTNNSGVLTVNAVVASESHNMCFDFNNVSKNLRYTNNDTAKTQIGATPRDFAPGDVQNPNFETTKSNYGMLLNETLANRINQTNNVVSDNGQENGKQFFFYKYGALPVQARKMIWSDTYMGAIRPGNLPSGFNTKIYSNGTLNFTGMIVSRFGDINADAGVRDESTGGRKDQLGYVNQFITFDTNLQDNSAPWFSMSSQRYADYPPGSFITWNILSYVDMGSLNWSYTQN